MKKQFFSRLALLLFMFIGYWFPLKAQLPNREVRGVWLATVYGIDWPSTKITTTGSTTAINSQKNQLKQMLDSLQSGNMNLVYFQVRSRADALYQSSYEPWSADFVAKRGMEPGYDPLAFMIEECHKRGIELYAWVNPFRFESSAGAFAGQSGDYNTTHPDWVLKIGTGSILNPGMPEVRTHISKIISEIVHNYDVDGVVFDDYFYIQGITSEDSKQQSLYKPSNQSVADWRRENVNKFVKQVYDSIQQIKPYVKFGIGPAGIYGGGSATASKYGITHPAGIGGGYAYNGIYCDDLAWLSGGYIDFISPQIYWMIGSGSTDYDVLSKWWSSIAKKYKRHCYVSHSLLNMSSSSEKAASLRGIAVSEYAGLSGLERRALQSVAELEGSTPPLKSAAHKSVSAITANFGFNEICNQIALNRKYDLNGAPGSVFYSAKYYFYNGNSVNYIRNKCFPDVILTPAISWKQPQPQATISNIQTNRSTKVITWNCDQPNYRFSIYALDKSNLTTAPHLLGMRYSESFTLPAPYMTGNYEFAVAPLDRYGNEGAMIRESMSAGTPETLANIQPKVLMNGDAVELFLPVEVASPLTVDLYSITGQFLQQLLKISNPSIGERRYLIPSLEKGIYLLKIQLNGKWYKLKFVRA